MLLQMADAQQRLVAGAEALLQRRGTAFIFRDDRLHLVGMQAFFRHPGGLVIA